MNRENSPSLDRLSELAQQTLSTVERTVIGQRAAIEPLLAAFMAGGHVLLHGVPGIGKTLLARTFSACLGVELSRVQFTPDLMPTDVTGTNVFDQASKSFRLVKGPIFTQILMGDEINRTPPKTQSALLEAMQERQVTIDGTSHPLDPDFFVIATQNPIEFEGTYPLPEAQTDRFLVRVEMGLPAKEHEIQIYREAVQGSLAGWVEDAPLPSALMSAEEASALRRASRRIHVADALVDYLARLSEVVRASPHVELGISPRGALAALEAARGWAVLQGREFLSPDDLKQLLVPSWAHRLMLTAESELEGFTPERVISEAAETVEVPRREIDET